MPACPQPRRPALARAPGPAPARRHSYRWRRFPCCGKRFPCDLCHEELTEDGHPSKWATSMACGYCSLEQPVAPQCRECGKKLATTAGATGRGCRGVGALSCCKGSVVQSYLY